jgi:predicted ester cyclase
MSALENKALFRRLAEALNTGPHGTWPEAFDAVCTTTFVLHDPMAPPGLPPGPQGLKDYAYVPFFAAFPDMQITIEDQIAEGDKAAVRVTIRGTHQGDFMGIAPTGKHVTITAIGIYRVEEGKIAETWQNLDTLGLMQQLGAIPQMAQTGA